MKDRRFIVGPDTLRMFELGHPWVLADRYTKRWPQTKAGDIVSLVDEYGRLQATALLEPQDRIVARVLEFGPMTLNEAWLRDKILRAWHLRQQFINLEATDTFRLINAEGDGLPGLTVDRYGDYFMVQIYAGGWKSHLDLVVKILNGKFQPKGIYEKWRPQKTRELESVSNGKKYSRLLTGAPCSDRLQVMENGLRFLVDLEDGLHTGLFLDQRVNRQDLMRRVAGKEVLNLFAYTGAFSVAAASAGASRVTSVDASGYYLGWAQENFAINRFNSPRHEFIVSDCLSALHDLRKQGRQFDLIFMDPPSFSTTKKSRFTTRGGTSELVATSLPLLATGGLMVTSSNHQKVDLPDYLKELRRGALQAHGSLQVIQILGQPEDFPFPLTFPEGRYLKYVVAVKG